jgi:hypothetical protein
LNEHCNNYNCSDRQICAHGCDRDDYEFNIIFFGLGMDANECPNYKAKSTESVDVDEKLIHVPDMLRHFNFFRWWMWW